MNPIFIIIVFILPFAITFIIATSKKKWLQILPFPIIILASIYGYLRYAGIIRYASDNSGGGWIRLWNTWEFNGYFILMMCASAFIGALLPRLPKFFNWLNDKWN